MGVTTNTVSVNVVPFILKEAQNMGRRITLVILLTFFTLFVTGLFFGIMAERLWLNAPVHPAVYVIHQYRDRWGGLLPYTIVYSVNGNVHRAQFESKAFRDSFRNHLYALGGKEW